MKFACAMPAIERAYEGVEEEWRRRAGDDSPSRSRGAVLVVACFQYLRAHVENQLLDWTTWSATLNRLFFNF